MEVEARFNSKNVLSPQPKRLGLQFASSVMFNLPRSYSCDTEKDEVINELTSILTTNEFSATALQFSDSRAETNPMIFDEKFVQLEYSLSTSEDSGSDSDRLVESV
jgi:hypothetical protein